ncbi:MAG: LysM peptidoglycan-binding domain-containing protein, partial [Verrucomicrobiota bacterium]
MIRFVLPVLWLVFGVQSTSADLQKQVREQERQIERLETEIERLRWELEREKARHSDEPMLLPELPGTEKSTPKSTPARKTTPTRFHTVLKGENMYRISLRHGLTLDQLQAANPKVNPLRLRIGQ